MPRPAMPTRPLSAALSLTALLLVSVGLAPGGAPTQARAAERCAYEATGTPVAYAAPAAGMRIRFEDVVSRGDTEQVRRELDYTARGGDGAEAEWTIHLASGQGLAVRTFLGLMQTANSSGTSSEFDRERFAALWPLDSGKSVDFTMTTANQQGVRYTTEISMCVRRFDNITLPAGNFDAIVIDAHSRIAAGAGKQLPFDEVFTRYWYVPEYGIYLQRVRAMYMGRREIMKQTRRALEVGG